MSMELTGVLAVSGDDGRLIVAALSAARWEFAVVRKDVGDLCKESRELRECMARLEVPSHEREPA